MCSILKNPAVSSHHLFASDRRVAIGSRTMTGIKTKVVLTVDTEASIAGAFGGNKAHTPLIHELVAGMVDGKSEALGFLVETLSRYGLVATFFVVTVQSRYFSDRAMGDYVER